MDTKKQFADQILAEMSLTLSKDEIVRLSNLLDSKLRDVEMIKESTEIACAHEDVNSKYIRLFVASRRLEGMSEKTISKYVYYAHKFFEYVDKDFNNVSTTDVQYFLSEYERTHDICKRSVDNLRKGVNGFFYWLSENEYIERNPVSRIKPIAYEKKKIEVLSDDEVAEIRDYVHDDPRTRAMVDLLLSTGVRVSELLAIRISDLDIERSEITVHCAKKHAKQDRVIFLNADARRSVKKYIEMRTKRGWMDSPYLFVGNKKGGRALTERLVNEKLKKIGIALNLPIKLTVHTFRRTLASNLYRKNLAPRDIAYILGHADSRMSEKYYIGIKNEDIKRRYENCM